MKKLRYIFIDGPFSGGIDPRVGDEVPVWDLRVENGYGDELESFGGTFFSLQAVKDEAERLYNLFKKQGFKAEIIDDGAMEV